ncbi:hypothetical protein GCM10010349_34710 [Streptomyces flavofungini]|nr:hypothetical protein GCM10010349_34710 [Streptomyces flavofungini]
MGVRGSLGDFRVCGAAPAALWGAGVRGWCGKLSSVYEEWWPGGQARMTCGPCRE